MARHDCRALALPPANKVCVGARGAQGLFPAVLQCHLEVLRSLASPEQVGRTGKTPAFHGTERTLPVPVRVWQQAGTGAEGGERKPRQGGRKQPLRSCVQLSWERTEVSHCCRGTTALDLAPSAATSPVYFSITHLTILPLPPDSQMNESHSSACVRGGHHDG